MVGNELFELVKSGDKPVVEFTEGCSNYESFDVKMRAKMVSMWQDDGCFGCEFDFSEYEDYNKLIEEPVWYGKNNELLKWSESAYYPNDKKVKIYIEEIDEPNFTLVEDNRPFSDYKRSESKLTYVQWLEEKYLKSL